MAALKSLTILRYFVLGIVLPQLKVEGKQNLVSLNENNWRDMLEGEWMVEFYAPWCPACKSLQPVWYDFSNSSSTLNIKVGQVDVTTSPGLSGRFMVTALPTIYHVIKGEFRQYKGGRDKEALISFIKDKKWAKIEPIPSWQSPSSFLRSVVSYFFKLSTVLRLASSVVEAYFKLASITVDASGKVKLPIQVPAAILVDETSGMSSSESRYNRVTRRNSQRVCLVIQSIHNHLLEEFGLPAWGSYLILAVATIFIGTFLGLILVCIIDCVSPPKSSGKSMPLKKEEIEEVDEVDDIIDEATENTEESNFEKKSETGNDDEDEAEEDDEEDEEQEEEEKESSVDINKGVRKRKPRKAM